MKKFLIAFSLVFCIPFVFIGVLSLVVACAIGFIYLDGTPLATIIEYYNPKHAWVRGIYVFWFLVSLIAAVNAEEFINA